MKILSALVTVIAGISAALALYWLLNKLAELLGGKREERIKPFFYILPAYLGVSLYLIYPALQTIVASFQDATSESFVGLDNYTSLLSSEPFQQTLINTMLWIILVPPATVALGLAVAVLADRLKPGAEKLSKTIIFMPMAIAAVGAATVWRFVYSAQPEGQAQIGLLNAIWTGLGGSPVAWLQQSDFRFNSILLMVVLLWAQVGFSMVLLSAAVKGVPADTLEAARIDGANERQTFFKVVVPQIKGTIITVFVTVTISVMKIFDIVYAMTNGNFNTNVLGNEFYNQLNTNFNNGAAAAIVVMLIIAVIPIMVYQVRNYRSQEAAA